MTEEEKYLLIKVATIMLRISDAMIKATAEVKVKRGRGRPPKKTTLVKRGRGRPRKVQP
jgi:AT hook motif